MVIAGGGITGLEALMALRDVAGDRVDLSLVTPEPDFTYKPLSVREPFSLEPAERHELEPWLREFDARLIRGALARVMPEEHKVELEDGSELSYDVLIVCMGGRARDAYDGAVTFRASGDSMPIDELLERSEADESNTLAFVVPPGVSWPLPLYELALMTRSRTESTGRSDLRLMLVTPEEAPLGLFGAAASEAVAELLRARRIEVQSGSYVHAGKDRRLIVTPGDEPLLAGAVVALPVIDGPALSGLPESEGGFIPIDDYARVVGVEDVYAAGDGTTFPIKQGGIGTQQADAAAEHIAARAGADVEPTPFHPVLRGQLITGVESLHLEHDPTGGHGEGTVSPDFLWWPPQKVGGRYLAAWLAHESPRPELEPPGHPLDVEVGVPHEWHGTPMTPGS